MFEALNLSCVRDERTLFSGLSFTLEPGEIVQIEGRNGAGKTSLMRILAGLSSADAGEVRWQGVNTRRQRDVFHQQLLYLGHQPGVKSVLTAFENLAFYLSVNRPSGKAETDADAIYQALDNVGLLGYEDVAVAQMSAGQQRRVALARLWLSTAPLWILDEPLTAIDKQGVTTLINLFQQHAEQGGMVLLTTHQDLQGVSRDVRKLRLTSEELA
ncbi:heme exporter protein A [Rahnella inusitata]|nr:heme exporter protein A [Rahnella inusitata]